ncbi:hypothetical protein PPL_09066 [Heterostelium album PN500]|uniref:Uncharacterized protein n=1 Tax=Heterostelium pallidum (strain ATCC 26659 / Pp 5 / PN500) TaxID=670386 RepID=D3BKI5_HETP5|nr:hypothetical protein PPL_09066 [Heterostelium album PN500]EFA78415.1 hypothetical protein PPL_09066 [Heterostelium album PN500]|eukprot:XP_020430540.1 hypothetical protein PPL_09066 [Heterostelium album PN500]
MGNVGSNISDEFKRVNKNGKDYLVLDELLEMQPPRECTIDTSHLGTLFAIDRRQTGRFYESDILEFSRLYASQLLQNGGKDDFQSKFQAYCTLKMWNEISKPEGTDLFVEWFSKLFTLNPNYVQTFKHHQDITFLTSDAINKMYQILSIKNYYGGDFRSFFDLMQRTAEEQGIMKLDEDELDDVVPLVILKNFSKDFISGFIKLMCCVEILLHCVFRIVFIANNPVALN